MKTPIQCQSETRFVALMSELFQMDEAQALDFGIYRVIRRHNRDILAYLGEVVTEPDGQQTLRGGTLAQTLDAAFAASDQEALAADKFRLQDLAQQLGLKPGLTVSERSARLAQAESFPTTQTLAAIPALALSYRLDSFSRKLYLDLTHASCPFGYQLQRAAGGTAAQAAEVDLVESVPYLLGLDVTRLYREPQGVVLLGRNRQAESVAVFFRDCAAANSAEWVQAKLTQYPANRVYTNNPAALSFTDCDRLESIEAVFALQFKRI